MTPSAVFQVAVFDALTAADGPLAEVFDELLRCEPRVHDRPPTHHIDDAGRRVDGPLFPYITLGSDDVIDDSNTCDAAFEVYANVHVWSRAVGMMEAKRLGDAVAKTLNAALAIDGFVCAHHEFRSARYFTDADGLTTHGVIVARFLIDPA